MLNLIKQTYTVLTVSLLLLVSCTEDVDFGQANDFRITPVIEASLIFLNEPANQFIDNGIEIVALQDSVDITFFDNKFIEDNLVKASFIFETNNSIHRSFQVEVDFLDEFDQLVHGFSFRASASPNNTDVIEDHEETFEDETLVALKATRKMIFTLSVLPGIPIDENTLGTVQLISKGVFYLNIGEDI